MLVPKLKRSHQKRRSHLFALLIYRYICRHFNYFNSLYQLDWQVYCG